MGGIGIANTMQVLLARRTLEIATLKTLGYGQRDLMALFGLETALLGITGSALGAGAAIALSPPLVASFERIGAMLLEWSVNPLVLLGGMLVGTLTALMFVLYAILQASAVRPVLLRALPVSRRWRDRFQALGLGLALAVPFGLLSSSIMGSSTWGVAIVGLAVAGLVGLGLLLGAALFLLVRLPLSRPRLLALARNNLKRQGLRTIFALIALFTGVLAVGLAVVMVRSAQDEFDRFAGSEGGYNLFVFAVTVAGLALVAGAVLIANAVGLAMVERRREMGLLKAVGFSSGDVLKTVLLEHGLLGLLAGVAGTVGVALAVAALNHSGPTRGQLSFEVLPALLVTLLAIAIALAAWHPARVRPLVVLREE